MAALLALVSNTVIECLATRLTAWKMWADSTTCLTVPSSGLPVDRPVSVYCIAPPYVEFISVSQMPSYFRPPRCLTDVDLSRLASKLIVSFVYSDDIVSRLSLGSVRDIRNAALWLCEANDNSGREGYSVVTHRTSQWKSREGSSEDMHWVSSSSLVKPHWSFLNVFSCMIFLTWKVSGDEENTRGKHADGRLVSPRSRLLGS